jgi:hypothetical protein
MDNLARQRLSEKSLAPDNFLFNTNTDLNNSRLLGLQWEAKSIQFAPPNTISPQEYVGESTFSLLSNSHTCMGNRMTSSFFVNCFWKYILCFSRWRTYFRMLYSIRINHWNNIYSCSPWGDRQSACQVGSGTGILFFFVTLCCYFLYACFFINGFWVVSRLCGVC